MLAQQLDLVDQRIPGVGAEQWLRAFLGMTLGFAEQPPALEDGARIDLPGAQWRDLEEEVHLCAGCAAWRVPEHRSGGNPRSCAQRRIAHSTMSVGPAIGRSLLR